jgi:probable rRNA maturation factor
LDNATPTEECQLSLVIADDDTLRRLNKDYRGLDEVTDVLSFSPVHQGHWQGEGEPPSRPDDGLAFVLPPDEPRHLGEVFISFPQVQRQAAAGPAGLQQELALLVTHGVLHLLGFDHVVPSAEADMRAREKEILSAYFDKVGLDDLSGLLPEVAS